ncbi:hypothetical protein R6Q57_028520 [Mikania cordata]
MSNRRGKDLINEDDNCQPVLKSSTWILEKLRNPNKCSLSSSSTSKTTYKSPPEIQTENRPENSQPTDRAEQRSRRWTIPDDESDNWSKDVIEFFNNGDASFCYSVVFYTPLKLDQLFWGTLLGYMGNGYLSAAVKIYSFMFDKYVLKTLCNYFSYFTACGRLSWKNDELEKSTS